MAVIATSVAWSHFPASARAQPTPSTTIVAVSGDPAPDGNGFFYVLGFPALNDPGQAAFKAHLAGTSGGTSDSQGIFRGDGTSLVQIARAGEAAPDGNGNLSSFSDPALNNAGQAAFHVDLTGTFGSQGIFRGNGSGGLVQIVRKRQVAPDGNGRFYSFVFPALNEAGQVAFFAYLENTSGGANNDEGAFRGNSSASLVQIAREGQAAPGGNGSISDPHYPEVNDAGQVAFRCSITGTSGGGSDNGGIFRGDGSTGLVQIARKGQSAPDGNGNFSWLSLVSLNEAGQVAFSADLTGTNGGASDRGGIFRGGGSTGLVQIARAGQAAPDGNGSFLGFSTPVLNDTGQAAFRAALTGTIGGLSDDWSILRGDGSTGPVQIAREGQAAPDGNGSFSSLRQPTLNDAGQVAFEANLTGDATRGIFLYDDSLGLLQVARTGDALLGSTIGNVGFNSSSSEGALSDERNGLNELGQVAYWFSLADGRGGIAIWNFGEPPLTGDMNCNGVVNVADIGGFVLALTNPSGYAAQYPGCNITNGDMDSNGVISVGDIGPFVALLTGG